MIDEGRMREAKLRADDAVLVCERAPFGFYAHGMVAQAEKKDQEALKFFSKALSLDAGHADSKLAMAKWRLARGQRAQREDDVTEGRLFTDAGDAIEELTKGGSVVAPKDADGLDELMATIAEEGDRKERVTELDWRAVLQLAETLLTLGKHAEAERAYKRAHYIMTSQKVGQAKLDQCKYQLGLAHSKAICAPWYAGRDKLTGEAKAQAVVEKLRECNGGQWGLCLYRMQGRRVVSLEISQAAYLAPVQGYAVNSITISKGPKLCDLSPLSGIPLKELIIRDCPALNDISVVRGMPLTKFTLVGSPEVLDISALRGLPLESLTLAAGNISDISALAGAPLKSLDFFSSSENLQSLSLLSRMSQMISLRLQCFSLRTVSMLKGLELEHLNLYHCPLVSDLSPLKGMPLRTLKLEGCASAQDLSVLKDLPLEDFYLGVWWHQIRDPSGVEAVPILRVRKAVGSVYLKLQQYDRAEKVYRSIVKEWPGSNEGFDGLRTLAQIHIQGATPKSVELVPVGYVQAPSNRTTRRMKQVQFSNASLDQAIDLCNYTVENYPDVDRRVVSYMLLARALLEKGQTELARRALRLLLGGRNAFKKGENPYPESVAAAFLLDETLSVGGEIVLPDESNFGLGTAQARGTPEGKVAETTRAIPFEAKEVVLTVFPTVPLQYAACVVSGLGVEIKLAAPNNSGAFFMACRHLLKEENQEAAKRFQECAQLDPESSYGRQAARMLEKLTGRKPKAAPPKQEPADGNEVSPDSSRAAPSSENRAAIPDSELAALRDVAEKSTNWRAILGYADMVFKLERYKDAQKAYSKALGLMKKEKADQSQVDNCERRLGRAQAKVICAAWYPERDKLKGKAQAEAVIKKLRECNGDTGEWEYRLEGKRIARLVCRDGRNTRTLQPLSGLQMDSVSLSNCPDLVDFSPLQGTHIRELTLAGCTGFTDLDTMAGLPLEKLTISGSFENVPRLKDLRGLQGMPLTELSLYYCLNVNDISPLKGLPLRKLKITALGNRQPYLSDLGPLQDMKLESLGVHAVRLSDLRPLRGMPLRELDLSSYVLHDLSPLRGMHTLESLRLVCVCLTSLDPLEGLGLKRLEIGPCGVSDLSPLRGCPLERFELTGGWDQIKDPSGVEDVPVPSVRLSVASVYLKWRQYDKAEQVYRSIAEKGAGTNGAYLGLRALAQIQIQRSPPKSPMGVPVGESGFQSRQNPQVEFTDTDSDRAVEICSYIIQKCPSKAERAAAYMLRARIALERGDLGVARKELETIHRECVRDEEGKPPYPESVAAAHILGEFVTVGGDMVLPEHVGLRDAEADLPEADLTVRTAPLVEKQHTLGPTEVALTVFAAHSSGTRGPHTNRGAELRLEAPKNAPTFFIAWRQLAEGGKDWAIQSLRRCVKLDPESSYGRQAARMLVKLTGRKPEAVPPKEDQPDGNEAKPVSSRAAPPSENRAAIPNSELAALRDVAEKSTDWRAILGYADMVFKLERYKDAENAYSKALGLMKKEKAELFQVENCARRLGTTRAKVICAAWYPERDKLKGKAQAEAVIGKLRECNGETGEWECRLEGKRLLRLVCRDGRNTRYLQPLSGLQVDSVSLSNCPELVDFSPLKSTHIKELSLIECTGFVDLATMAGLPLEKLTISGSPLKVPRLTDLRGLQGMPLAELALHHCLSVSDISPLKGLPLTKLAITAYGMRLRGLSDLSPLRGMKLGSLRLYAHHMADLRPLSGMPLRELDLSSYKLHDLSPLREMHTLESLRLECNFLTSLAALKGLALKRLDLHCFGLRDLSAVKGMPLRSVSLDDCRVLEDLSPLKGCPLERFELNEGWNQIRDPSGVEEMPVPSVRLSAASVYLKWREYDKAERVYRSIADKWPGTDEAYMGLRALAQIHMQRSTPKSLVGIPVNESVFRLKGNPQVDFAEADANHALEICSYMIQKYRGRAERAPAYMLRARVALEKGDLEAARKELEMLHQECVREEENKPPYPESVAAAHILGEFVTVGGDMALPEHIGLRDAEADLPEADLTVQTAPSVKKRHTLGPTEIALTVFAAHSPSTRGPHTDRGAELRLEAPKNAPLFFIAWRQLAEGGKDRAIQSLSRCVKLDPESSYGRQAARMLKKLTGKQSEGSKK